MNELQSISQLFQNKLFRIPDYQRGYAWKQEQLVDFWDDLTNLQMDRYHYTGLLSLKAVPKSEAKTWENERWLLESGFKAYHVVDGQQRLTTFAILLNEIVCFVKNMDCYKDKPEEEIVVCYETLKEIRAKYISRRRPPQNIITTYLFGYETDNPSADYLKYKVFNEPFAGTVNETYYTKNLKYAKGFFFDCVQQLYKEEGFTGIENIFRKLTLQLMFNIHEIEDDYDVFVAFETMNNRGKKLTNLELLKNRLIYLTTLFSDGMLDTTDKVELRKKINDTWKEVYYQLGRNQNIPLPDDDFLRAHWIIYFQYSRKKGDDYIKFLLNKFSAKNIFEKQATPSVDETLVNASDADFDDDDTLQAETEPEVAVPSKLEPHEIASYVDSLKETAKYWYYTFFPEESDLTSGEKEWLDKLNRIGIGYFRPLVAATLTPSANASSEDRITLFKAIERFIFLGFRMGVFQSSYKSSDYYRKAKDIYTGSILLSEVTQDINDTIAKDSAYAISNFITRIGKKFTSGEGFYGWRDLRYLLYEYEYAMATKNNLTKVNWELFTKSEKDKVTIEHILPQTPSKLYWRNQFRQFSDAEKKILAGSLGNLLPLAQSINSSLQNDSFDDKKTSTAKGHRGYENGSHSEIEVSKEVAWDAERILTRGLKLLCFMEARWQFAFEDERQRMKLLHLEFVREPRNVPDELSEDTHLPVAATQSLISNGTTPSTETSNSQLAFWTAFVEYCRSMGRGDDIASRKFYPQNWYDVSIGSGDYSVFFNVIGKSTLRIGLYVYAIAIFERLEAIKPNIENSCGFQMEWYTSKTSSTAKRI